MLEYRIVKKKDELKDIFSFRREVIKQYKGRYPSDPRDDLDTDRRTTHFIAAGNGKILASARIIMNLPEGPGFRLPMEHYFSLTPAMGPSLRFCEFSRFFLSGDAAGSTALVKLLHLILHEASRQSARYLCTIADMDTDDLESARIIYGLVQVKKLIHPDLQTLPVGERGDSGPSLYPFYSKTEIKKIKEHIRPGDKILKEWERKRSSLPASLLFLAGAGFYVTSVPSFIPEHQMYGLPMILDVGQSKVRDLPDESRLRTGMTVPLQEISCKTPNAIIQYVRAMNKDTGPLFKGILFSAEYLEDENNWVDCATISKMFRNARLMLRDKEIGYKIGFSSSQLRSVGIINTLYRLFSNPVLTAKMTSSFIRLWNRVQSFNVRIISRNTIEVIISRPAVPPTRDICAFHRGVCEAMPAMWNLKTKVKEVECVRTGAPHCRFIMEWEAEKSLIKKAYYYLLDPLVALLKARFVLKQKGQLLKKKYLELRQKTMENIRLNRLLDRRNIEVQATIK
ncbi:MAG: 4-vinyl reductase, partial [bacterium]|nr:4-vinyl reductase [bacterium]